MPSQSDLFWGDNLGILFRADRLVEFFPTPDQSLAEKMNAITRLIIYISIVLSVIQENTSILTFGAFLAFLIYSVMTWQTVEPIRKIEKFETSQAAPAPPEIEPADENACTLPTIDNPYMNFLLYDDPARPPACEGPGVQEMAANLLDAQLYMDVEDLYANQQNQRAFYTMPNTTRIPDRVNFARWLFTGSSPCKTDGLCEPFEDLRLQQPLIPE